MRVKATVNGLTVGERCMLVVVDRRGNHTLVGSWVVTPTEEKLPHRKRRGHRTKRRRSS